MNATELMKRVVTEIEKHGIICEDQKFATYTKHEVKTGETLLHIEEVYRHNGTDENVTVNIECYEITKVYQPDVWNTKRRGNIIKVPKNASNKVIKNRVEKAIALMNQ